MQGLVCGGDELTDSDAGVRRERHIVAIAEALQAATAIAIIREAERAAVQCDTAAAERGRRHCAQRAAVNDGAAAEGVRGIERGGAARVREARRRTCEHSADAAAAASVGGAGERSILNCAARDGHSIHRGARACEVERAAIHRERTSADDAATADGQRAAIHRGRTAIAVRRIREHHSARTRDGQRIPCTRDDIRIGQAAAATAETICAAVRCERAGVSDGTHGPERGMAEARCIEIKGRCRVVVGGDGTSGSCRDAIQHRARDVCRAAAERRCEHHRASEVHRNVARRAIHRGHRVEMHHAAIDAHAAGRRAVVA